MRYTERNPLCLFPTIKTAAAYFDFIKIQCVDSDNGFCSNEAYRYFQQIELRYAKKGMKCISIFGDDKYITKGKFDKLPSANLSDQLGISRPESTM